MKRLPNNRTLALVGVLIPLFALFIYVALRSGPLAVTAVENRALSPALFGIGTVETRYTYKIGPTVAGRIKTVNVHVGDTIAAGQLLGEMDPVDLDDRIKAQQATLRQKEADLLAAEAGIREATARQTYAAAQAHRYEQLLSTHAVSEESVEARQQERQVTEASLAASLANRDAGQQELAGIRAELAGLREQRANLRLVAPVDGLLVARHADPGTTMVAGQAVVEMIDPASLWINVRFDQLRADGLRPGLPARIVLRSRAGQQLAGQVLRVEPLADAVTEETLAKVIFTDLPQSLPPLGELAEVTLSLAELPPAPALPNAALHRVNGQLGVWLIPDHTPRFAPVKTGAADLDGLVQILDGVQTGEPVVLYSQRALKAGSRIKIVHRLPGVAP
ncbi:MAG: efflux RND transporter periplasmic adaptor subunit [Deltaproteobacteria bacterium]|nr:efflux RND transporter periplasmic adaptor subunit [Deltaproteobacteria bacterium]